MADRKPQRRGEPADRRHERLGDRQQDGRRPIDAAQDGDATAVGESAPDHASSSSSSSADRVASSWAGSSHARRARSTAYCCCASSSVRCASDARVSRAPRAAGGAGQRVLQVETRAAVDLQRGAASRGGLEDARPVERQRVAAVDDPARRVRQHVDVRVLDGRQGPLRELLGGLVAAGVDAGDDDVEASEHLVGVVEGRIGPDLELGAVEDAERRELGVERERSRRAAPRRHRGAGRARRRATASGR